MPKFDRRELLKSAAVVSVGPKVGIGVATASFIGPEVYAVPSAEPAGGNFSAGTARRLAEIARRNELKAEAKLPLLVVARELRRMRDAETACQFEKFVSVHGREVFDGLLAVRRSVEGLEWKPRWMDCVLYQSKVRSVLRTRFERTL